MYLKVLRRYRKVRIQRNNRCIVGKGGCYKSVFGIGNVGCAVSVKRSGDKSLSRGTLAWILKRGEKDAFLNALEMFGLKGIS